jgi:uncharacterized protein DUF4382
MHSSKLSPLTTIAAAALLAVGVFACGGGDTAVQPGPASPSPTATTSTAAPTPMGTLAIHITDSPFSEAKALLVTFSEVSIHRADTGDWITLPFGTGSSRTCDLKKLSGATDVLGVAPLAAGHYTQIRLTVTTAVLYFDNVSVGGPCAPQIAPPMGMNAPVTIPSGEVKLNNEFTVATTGTKIVLDFDGDQSVHQTGSGNGRGNGNSKYMMAPVIRVVSVQ